LALVKLKKSRETTQVDLTEKLEEFDSVFGVFGKVLVDHVESAFKDGTENSRYVLGHQAL
jgi:hypothetical protein